ncbi:MAG: SRPBCC domain-containing protein [Cyclobacteriaceae bacterium]|nr:SRPBCC domain-containing protein [Cyclobacteriaceae bacterium]
MKKTITKHSATFWSIYTEIVIDAPKERVWTVLTDFNNIAQWSTTLQNLEGNLSNGSKTIVDYIFKGKLRKIKHTMVEFENGTQFGWSDTIIPFVKDYHLFRVEDLKDGRTKFIQKDEVKGFFAFLVANMLMNEMSKTYPEFNQLLKYTVENKYNY